MQMRKRTEHILTILIYVASVGAVTTLLMEYGYKKPPMPAPILHAINYAIVAIFISNTIIKLIFAPSKLRYLKLHIIEFILVTMFIVTLLLIRELAPSILHKNIIAATRIYLVIVQIYILVYMAYHLSFVGKKVSELGLKPPQIVLLSFLIVVLTGTLLLSLPNATASGVRAPLLTALFTATSATTVTGLIVVDTGSYFSHMGQIVILTLIQIGGLGMMTLVAFFSMIVGRGMGLRESALVGDILDHDFMGRVGSLIVVIILTTAALELIGTGLLYLVWKDESFLHGGVFYFSLFHAISAFCNAGFSLFQDSFIRFRTNYPFNFIVITLIILGGLGFQVLKNIFSTIRYRINKRIRRERISLHTKLVLTATAILLALGTTVFFGLLGGADESGFGLPQRAMVAFFQSVTTRTAGFNTTNIGAVSVPFLFMALVLMFIGASPGSTGGGIKTSTAAVIFAYMLNIFTGRGRVSTFKRSIPDELIKKTFAVLIASFTLIALVTFMLTLFEKYSFMDLLFEVTSAVGTVGLSRGITPYLTQEGKILITIAMFLGRIGPLTLFLALSYAEKKAIYEYPEERVLIG